MKLTILGMSPSFPNPGGASSGYLFQSGSTNLLVDCGHGVGGVLEAAMDPRDLQGIVISHMHPDHFFDLVPLTYAFRFAFTGAPPVPLFLPPGGKDLLQLLQSVLHLPDDFFTQRFRVAEYQPASALSVGVVVIQFAPTKHYIDAFAMRLSAPQDGSIVYSSDTGWAPEVIALARGADLGLIEATSLEYPDGEEFHGHLTAELAGKLASEAEIGQLVLTHFWKPLGNELLAAARKTFDGPVELAGPGRQFEV